MRKTFLLVLSFLMCSCAGAADIDRTKFDTIYRVTKEIEGASNVGVSYNDFSKLIQDFSTAIEIAKDAISTEKEQQLLVNYESALECYTDSLTLWYIIIHYDIDNAYEMQGSRGEMHPQIRNTIPLLNKYGMEPEQVVFEWFDEKRRSYVAPKQAVQKIWLQAFIRIEEANKILLKNNK